jgi:hypothetical protein
VAFSEPVQRSGAENPENYELQPEGIRPDSVLQDFHNPSVVSVYLHDSLLQGTIGSLYIRNIMDASGNMLNDTSVTFCFYHPGAYDILIHEIMADPDPAVELPDGEYVELYNRSAFPVNLAGWTFKYGSYSKVFTSMTIPSKGYLLIVKDSAYLNFAPCAVLFTSSSSLSNEGTILVLKDDQQHVIHSVEYSPDWYRGSFKQDGGWSLEMTDPLNPCGCMDNWEASKDASGGTPGKVNSIRRENPDEIAPVALRAVILDSVWVEITFSEAMDSVSLGSKEDWILNDPEGLRHPAGILPVNPGYSKTVLLFDKNFTPGVIYTLQVTANLKDCAGNACDTSRSIRFAFPDSVAAHDVVINEILSNPASGGSRFVELYNRSEKIIDLQALAIASGDTVAGMLSDAMPLMSGGYLLFPGDYIALAPNPEDLKERYRPAFHGNIVAMTGFPVFGDDAGRVVLVRKDNLAIIDLLKYTNEMHYPLLATSEGVSLERTNPDLPSENKSNWHSAAETAGFATPGYQNSHWIVSEETDRDVLVQPAIFSPDNDGRDDLLSVTIRDHEADYAVTISVYDHKGLLIRQIANNVLTGSEGVFIWDGMTADRRKAPLGIYVLLIELVNPAGPVKKIKRTAILGGKM